MNGWRKEGGGVMKEESGWMDGGIDGREGKKEKVKR